MASATLRFNTAEAVRRIRQLRERAPQAIARALNRSIASAKTVMVREVAADMGLKVSDVREKIWTVEARPDKATAALWASPKRIPLIDFSARGPYPSRGKGRGVTSRLPGGAGRYPHAFIATLTSGHRGVFQRKTLGQGRLPIRELHGPSIVRVFLKHVDVGLARGEEQLVKNLQSEIRFALRA